MSKFLVDIIQFVLYVGLFYFITIPIFDFIASDYSNRFRLAWSVSMVLAIFSERLVDIKESIDKKNKKDE
jgi:hypothetical protein